MPHFFSLFVFLKQNQACVLLCSFTRILLVVSYKIMISLKVLHRRVFLFKGVETQEEIRQNEIHWG